MQALPSAPTCTSRPCVRLLAMQVSLGEHAFKLVASNQLAQGDVLTVAQLAGIMGAKHTSMLIPLCHGLHLSKVDVQLQLLPDQHAVKICSMARIVGQTGVEMEALTAASVAALTVYDMCKGVNKSIVISNVQLDFKSGGKNGASVRPGSE